MKPSLALIAAGGLTVVVAVTIVFTMLSRVVTPTEANQETTNPIITRFEAEQNDDQTGPSPVAAVAPAINPQVETAIREREQTLQTQVSQRRDALAELDRTSQVQIDQLQVQLLELQAQIDHTAANIPALQANVAALQRAIQDDDATFQNELTKLTEAEAQLRGQLETATARLNAAYSEIAQRQAVAAATAGSVNSSGGRGSQHDDDDDDRYEHHEDDDDDNHDDRDEGHEDDD